MTIDEPLVAKNGSKVDVSIVLLHSKISSTVLPNAREPARFSMPKPLKAGTAAALSK